MHKNAHAPAAAPDDDSRCLLSESQRYALCLTGARLRVKGRLGNPLLSEYVLRASPAPGSLPYTGALHFLARDLCT